MMCGTDEQKDLPGGNYNIKMRDGQSLKFCLWSSEWKTKETDPACPGS